MAKEIRHRAFTHYYERKLGVETRGFFYPELALPDSKPYGAIGYEHIFWALHQVPFPSAQVELVDFGCGKGRAIAAAATRPYRSVIGVELSPELVAAARRNLDAMQKRQAGSVSVHQGDATRFVISPTANVFYFFNPFKGETLRHVIANIRASIQAHPRPAFIVYFNHEDMEQIIAGEGWIRKVYDGRFYPQFGCGLYRI